MGLLNRLKAWLCKWACRDIMVPPSMKTVEDAVKILDAVIPPHQTVRHYTVVERLQEKFPDSDVRHFQPKIGKGVLTWKNAGGKKLQAPFDNNDYNAFRNACILINDSNAFMRKTSA